MTEARYFMKHIFNHSILWIATLLVLFATSCSGDDDPKSSALDNDVSGTWYGTRFYIVNGNVKFQYLTLTLDSNGSGTMIYDAPDIYSTAHFRWSVKGNNVVCRGAYANTDGDLNDDYTLECQIKGDQLKPLNHYSLFILTKDDSILVDENGNITMNPDEQLDALRNVWVSTDRTTVIRFYQNNSYDEYVLTAPGSDFYKVHNTGDYSLNAFNKTLLINSALWDVETLTNETLVIKNGTRQLKYSIGSYNDMPKEADLEQLLTANKIWYNSKYQFVFYDRNKISYIETSDKSYGSWGKINLTADGIFDVNGNTVTCYFSDVSWQDGSGGASKLFSDWTNGQACTKKYIFEALITSELKVTLPNSKVIYLEKR